VRLADLTSKTSIPEASVAKVWRFAYSSGFLEFSGGVKNPEDSFEDI